MCCFLEGVTTSIIHLAACPNLGPSAEEGNHGAVMIELTDRIFGMIIVIKTILESEGDKYLFTRAEIHFQMTRIRFGNP